MTGKFNFSNITGLYKLKKMKFFIPTFKNFWYTLRAVVNCHSVTFIYLSIYLFIYLFIYLSIYLFNTLLKLE